MYLCKKKNSILNSLQVAALWALLSALCDCNGMPNLYNIFVVLRQVSVSQILLTAFGSPQFLKIRVCVCVQRYLHTT